jgi:hypothetical protein
VLIQNPMMGRLVATVLSAARLPLVALGQIFSAVERAVTATPVTAPIPGIWVAVVVLAARQPIASLVRVWPHRPWLPDPRFSPSRPVKRSLVLAEAVRM